MLWLYLICGMCNDNFGSGGGWMWVGLVWFGLVEVYGFWGRWVGLLHHGYFSFFFFRSVSSCTGAGVILSFPFFPLSPLLLLTSHFFFTFTSVIFFSLSLLSFFFFTFLLSLWSQVCVRCIKCIYISLGLFFLLLFFTSFLYLLFFFPSLSLSLSLLLALYASFVIWTIYTRMNKTKLKVDRSTHVLL